MSEVPRVVRPLEKLERRLPGAAGGERGVFSGYSVSFAR